MTDTPPPAPSTHAKIAQEIRTIAHRSRAALDVDLGDLTIGERQAHSDILDLVLWWDELSLDVTRVNAKAAALRDQNEELRTAVAALFAAREALARCDLTTSPGRYHAEALREAIPGHLTRLRRLSPPTTAAIAEAEIVPVKVTVTGSPDALAAVENVLGAPSSSEVPQ